jgi:hypothetical protein
LIADALTRDLPASRRAKARPIPSVGVGGLLVGVLDLIYAVLVYSPKNPILIPQTIASGLLGLRSYSGGALTATLGIVLHFLIAFGAATVYYLASRKVSFLIDHAVLSVSSTALWSISSCILWCYRSRRFPPSHMPLIYQAYEFVEHWFCVGLPIALSIRRYSH